MAQCEVPVRDRSRDHQQLSLFALPRTGMQLQPVIPFFFGVAASQRTAEDVSLQIIQGTERILCAKKALHNVSPDRVHPECVNRAIAVKTSNLSQGCLTLERDDRIAFRAAVRRITDARPVRSPPFGFFRPPTPSPVEICIMHALGNLPTDT